MSYDPELALTCANYSAEVYSPDLEFRGDIIEDPNRHFISIDGTQVLLVNNAEAIYIIFRGTTYEDLMTDLKFRKERTNLGLIHRGFLNYAQVAFDAIYRKVLEWGKTKPLIVTGHSLGAAGALITAAFMNQNGFNIYGLYTFGCPRVGNRQFATYVDNAFDGKHFRHVNAHDGVPMVPPLSWGYRHCGQRFYFSTYKQRLVRNAPLCQVVLERLPILIMKPWKWAQSKLIDHAVHLYVSACERNL